MCLKVCDLEKDSLIAEVVTSLRAQLDRDCQDIGLWICGHGLRWPCPYDEAVLPARISHVSLGQLL